jgi:hypothetical protein
VAQRRKASLEFHFELMMQRLQRIEAGGSSVLPPAPTHPDYEDEGEDLDRD